MDNLEVLVNRLCEYSSETNWFEFKHDNYEPDMIGADISALANGAAYSDKNYAYMIWGIDDTTHDIVGTHFDQYKLKVGNQEIESWLRNMLSKNAEFEFHSLHMKDKTMNDKHVVVLIICRATGQTVQFKKVDYIRVGSYTVKLSEYPQMQAQLWDKIRNARFEEQFAKINLKLNEALNLIDYPLYFDTIGIIQPSDTNGASHYLLEEGIIVEQDNGLYAVTNMGAILFAKKLSDFPRIMRKAVRVIKYEGNNRVNILKENVDSRGYAIIFEGLMKYIEALIPTQEIIDGAIRRKVTAYPMLAIRESISNALIHQDFSVVGTGVTIEIFDKRIEITNSGIPLVNIDRIIDNPPRSRNEKLASLMRRLGMCEELGTGWDKMVISCEMQQLPAPKIYEYEDSTKVTLYCETAFSDISQEDRQWACYLHACVLYVQGEYLTNASLRKRFGLKDTASGSISRLIKEAVELGYIKAFNPDTAPRYMKYVPFWA